MKLPVIIPAHNEAVLIARTLDHLPSDLFDPIVVANDSEDETVNIANRYGAEVIELEEHGKLPAIQETLRRMGRKALEPIAIIDADTYPVLPRLWQASMLSQLYKGPQNEARGVSGFVRFVGSHANRENSYTRKDDIAYSLDMIWHAVKRKQGEIQQTGPNMGIHLKRDDVLEQVLGLCHYWPYEDKAIADTVHANGKFVQSWSPSLYASTRIMQCFPPLAERFNNTKEQNAAYGELQWAKTAAPGAVPYRGLDAKAIPTNSGNL